ncbi:MAG: dockerin type I repeat-containing protein [Oscillospiraceae bacterium]|nr:dockerin type I repeat-containing protein [Oscillospiraceae bacterium]
MKKRFFSIVLAAIMLFTLLIPISAANDPAPETGELPPIGFEQDPSGLYGDANGDGVVNGKDITLMRRFFAGGYNVTIKESLCDVNGDEAINGKDLTLIRRYLVGGYEASLVGTPKN